MITVCDTGARKKLVVLLLLLATRGPLATGTSGMEFIKGAMSEVAAPLDRANLKSIPCEQPTQLTEGT